MSSSLTETTVTKMHVFNLEIRGFSGSAVVWKKWAIFLNKKKKNIKLLVPSYINLSERFIYI